VAGTAGGTALDRITAHQRQAQATEAWLKRSSTPDPQPTILRRRRSCSKPEGLAITAAPRNALAARRGIRRTGRAPAGFTPALWSDGGLGWEQLAGVRLERFLAPGRELESCWIPGEQPVLTLAVDSFL